MSLLNWNTPITISDSNASDPHVVIDKNGNSTAIWFEQSIYNIGTASQSGTTIIGFDAIFTNSMVGGTITYNNGIMVPIIEFVNATSLITTISLTVITQSYTIYYNGIIVTKYFISSDNQMTETKYLSTIGNNSITPKICIDGNGIISTVWVENSVINYSSNNGAWSFVISLSQGIGARNPVLSVDNDGNIAICWVKNGLIETIIKPISTGTWSSVKTFTTVNSDNPSIGISGGIVTIVWHAKPTTQDQILASTATIINNIFSPSINVIGVTNSGRNHNFPVVAVDPNGNSLVVWYRSDFNGVNNYVNVVVLSALLRTGSSSWDFPVKISSQGIKNPSDLIIKIGFDFVGNCYVLWTSYTVKNYYNIECSGKQLGGNFNIPFQIVSNNLTSKNASISISSLSDVLIIYMDYNGANSTIQALETTIGGLPSNNYTLPIMISTENTNNARPEGSLSLTDNTINTVVVWQTYDSINNTTKIQLSTGSKPLLGPPSNLINNQTVNDFGLFTEFDNNLSWTVSTDPNTIGYNIYRNNIFIVQVDYTTTTFVDRNCISGVTYSIVSIDSNFQQSRWIEVIM